MQPKFLDNFLKFSKILLILADLRVTNDFVHFIGILLAVLPLSSGGSQGS